MNNFLRLIFQNNEESTVKRVVLNGIVCKFELQKWTKKTSLFKGGDDKQLIGKFLYGSSTFYQHGYLVVEYFYKTTLNSITFKAVFFL